MALNPDSRARFNLEQASILVLEPHAMGMNLIVEILSRFGARNFRRCFSVAEAKESVEAAHFDLMMVDAMAGEGVEFVRWLRRTELKPNAYVPIILMSGHTPAKLVAEARDCGAHFVMVKPLAPTAVLERILWLAREGRQFVACDSYAGPDRRFQNIGVPPGMKGRRRGDAAEDLGDAQGPNLDQSLIDGLMKPTKVHL